MGKCSSTVEETRFIVKDELTEAYILVRAVGDCPEGVQGWHHKTFAASVSIVDVLEKHFDDMLLWPLNAPPN